MDKKEKQKKKDRLALFLCIAGSAAIIVIMLAMIIHTRNTNKPVNQTGSTPNNETLDYDKTQVDEAKTDAEKITVYTGGLKEDGRIDVENIDSLVSKFGLDGFDYSVYKDDFANVVEHGEIIYRSDYLIGDYLLKKIVDNSTVKKDDSYYNYNKNLIKYLVEKDFEQYTTFYQQANKDTWEDIYHFLKLNPNQYEYYLNTKASENYKYNVVADKLIKEFNITASEEDMVDYLMKSDVKAKTKTEAYIMIKQMGKNYIAQKAMIWKLKYALYEKANLVDGHYYDKLTSHAADYDKLFMADGKIKDLGDIDSYVTLPDIKELDEKYNTAYEAYMAYSSNVELNKHEEFYNRVMATNVEGQLDSQDAKESFYCACLINQAIINKLSISIDNYEYAFLEDNGYTIDDKNKLLYEYGQSGYRALLMNYAAIQGLGVEMGIVK